LLCAGIFLHVLADALGSVGVIISSLLIHFFGWTRADAICSMFIAGMIVASVIPLIRSSARILLQRTPAAMQRKLRNALQKVCHIIYPQSPHPFLCERAFSPRWVRW